MSLTIANPTSQLTGRWVLTKDYAEDISSIKTLIGSAAIVAGDTQVGHEWRKTTVIANVDVKLLPTVPYTLVAAPGANKVIFLSKTVIYHKFNTAYTNIDAAGALRIKRGSDIITSSILNNAGASITDLNTFLTGSKIAVFDRLQTINTTLGNLPKIFTFAANEAVTLDFSNGASGNLTGGNLADELIVVAYYSIFDFTGL